MNPYEREKKYIMALKNARRRCNEPANNRYQYYGAKGIRCELTEFDIIGLAALYRADYMDKPQLHRIDSSGNYTKDNCMFVEASEHSRLTHTGRKRSPEARLKMSKSGGTLFGEKHGMARLTNTQVRSIKSSKRKGVELAKKYGVAHTTISAIRTGQNWRHI